MAVSKVISITRGGLKCHTGGHSHNCGVEMYRKGNFYSIWKVRTGRGGSKISTHFLKTMQNVLKPLAKIQKKWDRNIHAKNSEVL